MQGPFSLAASTRFLEGFTPAGAFAAGTRLALAFPVEGDWRLAGALVRQDGERVVADVVGGDGGVTGPRRGPLRRSSSTGWRTFAPTMSGRRSPPGTSRRSFRAGPGRCRAAPQFPPEASPIEARTRVLAANPFRATSASRRSLRLAEPALGFEPRSTSLQAKGSAS